MGGHEFRSHSSTPYFMEGVYIALGGLIDLYVFILGGLTLYYSNLLKINKSPLSVPVKQTISISQTVLFDLIKTDQSL